MKRFVFYIIVGILVGCKNGKNPNPANQHLNQDIGREIILKNDTFCLENVQRFDLDSIKLIKGCHIILNDSLSDLYRQYWRNNSLPKEYNYDDYIENLAFTTKSDTLELRKLYLVTNRNYRFLPDTIFFEKDTLFTRENALRIDNKEDFRDMMYEEVYYQFLIKKIPIAIRWDKRLYSPR